MKVWLLQKNMLMQALNQIVKAILTNHCQGWKPQANILKKKYHKLKIALRMLVKQVKSPKKRLLKLLPPRLNQIQKQQKLRQMRLRQVRKPTHKLMHKTRKVRKKVLRQPTPKAPPRKSFKNFKKISPLSIQQNKKRCTMH